jgi:Domain of unknown function (DU1801)
VAKTELKTKETQASVEDFFNAIDDETMRNDCKIISEMMGEASDAEAKMWGANIVGFGSYHYKSKSGREGDWMEIGFSPRKANISLYGVGLDETLLEKLGKHKTGKGCLYVKQLSDVNKEVLMQMIEKSINKKRKK